MEEKFLNVIRNSEKQYISFEAYKDKLNLEEIKFVYSPEDIEALNKFIGCNSFEKVFDEQMLNDKKFNWIKQKCVEFFNPLKDKQDVLIFSKNKLLMFAIPYNYIRIFPNINILNQWIDEFNGDIKSLIRLILGYEFTKELNFINEIVDKKYDFNAVIFKLFKDFFSDKDCFNESILNKIYSILNSIKCEYILNGDSLEDKLNFIITIENNSNGLKKVFDNRNKEFEVTKKIYANKFEKQKNNKKNVIVFHLESLSNEIYFNHIARFKELNSLMNKSLKLSKFYSSATSSAMSLTDFLYGNDFETDDFAVFDNMLISAKYGDNLYNILNKNGYKTMGIGYNFFPSTEEVNLHNIWNIENEEYLWDDEFEPFINKITSFIDENNDNSFAIHIWDLLTHSGQKNEETVLTQTFDEKMDLAYTSLDITIKRVIECLKKNDLMQNTIIVGYGDHGDDKWTRGLNDGFTHIIDPYTNVIQTPAFIYDYRIEPMYFDEIVSLIDLKKTILFLLGINCNEEFKYSGINIFKEKNKYVYSKRLLANQRENDVIKSPAMIKLHGFNNIDKKDKSYAVISDRYSMTVTNKGMELFLNKIDPFSYSNLLTFFEIDKYGKILEFNNFGAWRGHFRNMIMQDEQIYDIIKNYYELREQIKERIQLKNNMIESKEKNLFNMNNLNKIAPRKYIID